MSEMNMTWRMPARKVRVKEIPQDKYPASSMALMFFVFSAFGWLWEITLTLFTDGAVVNRGVL